jgi:endonuclease/exonuclease/phosphatase family metal-dependent hydrolase
VTTSVDVPLLRTHNGGAQQPLGDEFLLVSWNIQRGRFFDNIANWLGASVRAHVCLLQEVDVHARRTAFRDIPADLSNRLAMNSCFAVEFEELAQRGDSGAALHGNLTLSSAPLQNAAVHRFKTQPHDWNRYRLPFAWLQPRRGGRISLMTEIVAQRAVIATYNVHLESRANDRGRYEQMKEVLREVESSSLRMPVIIAGDFNTHDGERSIVLEPLRAAGFEDAFHGATAPVVTKVGRNQRLDWVFVRGLRTITAKVRHVPLSDHYPLVVRLSLV